MLPTQSLFRSIPCPFFVSGLCERPHCLFRHTKSDIILARQTELVNGVGTEDDVETIIIKTEPAELTEKDGTIKNMGNIFKRVADAELESTGQNKRPCLEVEFLKLVVKTETLPVESENEVTVVPKIENEVSVENVEEKIKIEVKKGNERKSSKNSSSSSSSKSRSNGNHKSRSHSSSSSKHKSSKEKDGATTSSKSEIKKPSSHRSSSSSKNRSHSSKSSSSNKDSKSHRKSHNSTSSSHSKQEKNSNKKNGESRKNSSASSNTIITSDTSNIKFELPEISDFEDDPEDIEMQCMRLFESYQAEEKSIDNSSAISTIAEQQKQQPASSSNNRRRQAHAGADKRNNIVQTKPHVPKAASQNLHASVAARLQTQKQIVADTIPKVESQKKYPNKTNTLSTTTASNQTKKRIAHVPNVSGLLRPNSTSDNNNAQQQLLPDKIQTISKTTSKGTNRIAHLPKTEKSSQKATAKRPLVNIDSTTKGTGKISLSIRQKVMDQLYDAAVKLYNNPQDAFNRAITEESGIEIRSTTKAVYLSLSVGKVRALRKEIVPIGGAWTIESPSSGNQDSIPTPSPIIDERFLEPNFSILPVNKKFVRPTGNKLYLALEKYVLSDNDLVEHGYPRSHPSGEPGRAIAKPSTWDGPYVSEATRRTCDRCKKIFLVHESGEQKHEENCTFHPGRKIKKRVNRGPLVTFWNCCDGESGADGCTILKYHVPKSHHVNDVRGFIRALNPLGSENTIGNDPWDIIGIDCEMIYTTGGNLLARATVVGVDGKTLYDEIIKPGYPVLDYNSKFSGLTEEMVSRAKGSLIDVQAAILTHLKPNTMIIGHSLESDLIALRLIHDCVIDTSVLFPHPKGKPFKFALRTLSMTYLERIIQESEYGHDSAEDARSAMDLVLCRLSNGQ